MAKFCTNCGKELVENAAMCLNCGKLVNENNTNNNGNGKKKKKGLPTWAIVLIVVGCVILIPIIIIIVLGIIGYNVIKDSGVNIDDYLNESLTQRGTIGDTLKTDNLRIILTDALMYSSIEGEYFTDTPAGGKEFLVFFFDIENISDESEYISSYSFSGFVDGYSVSSKHLFNTIEGVEELGADLAPGMKANGYIAFEIDTTWKEFEVHFDDYDFDDNEKVIFKVVNEEDSNTNNGA